MAHGWHGGPTDVLRAIESSLFTIVSQFDVQVSSALSNLDFGVATVARRWDSHALASVATPILKRDRALAVPEVITVCISPVGQGNSALTSTFIRGFAMPSVGYFTRRISLVNSSTSILSL